MEEFEKFFGTEIICNDTLYIIDDTLQCDDAGGFMVGLCVSCDSGHWYEFVSPEAVYDLAEAGEVIVYPDGSIFDREEID